ncbi:MAG: FAD-dependent monooxygenase [Finegoldia sp.]|nr:FAD-dependent monooxygenase [Finegoldia sp.]
MLIIRNIKLKKDDRDELKKKIGQIIRKDDFSYQIYRKSIDARKGISFVYQVLVDVNLPEKVVKKNKDIDYYEEEDFILKEVDKDKTVTIVGTGPAGLFCGYLLLKYGARVRIIERGSEISKREEDIERFLKTGELDENSNVQFGEGGAGTFSDGKLTARTKDPRVRQVLQTFVDNGANEDIMYEAKPHIGTDILRTVIVNMRRAMIEMGGEFIFDSKFDDLEIVDGHCSYMKVGDEKYESDAYVLALGNSSRDTFYMLKDKIFMANKPFAVGFRIEHPQKMIDFSQYHTEDPSLPAASYQLSYSEKNKRGVYTFCMCPGGYVINASSERERLCVNGMSYHKRDGENANSALVCGIDESLYGENLLDGIKFQEGIEERAFKLGGSSYLAPVQRVGDYLAGKKTEKLGEIRPTARPGYVLADLNSIYPAYINENIKKALIELDKKLKGFAMEDALLTGVETRTSSPVRLNRDDLLRSQGIDNLYVIGEGSGYSGGIVSSAIDGLKAAESILTGRVRKY